jgi:hypothetical protein
MISAFRRGCVRSSSRNGFARPYQRLSKGWAQGAARRRQRLAWATRRLGNAPLGQRLAWATPHLGNASLGQRPARRLSRSSSRGPDGSGQRSAGRRERWIAHTITRLAEVAVLRDDLEPAATQCPGRTVSVLLQNYLQRKNLQRKRLISSSGCSERVGCPPGGSLARSYPYGLARLPSAGSFCGRFSDSGPRGILDRALAKGGGGGPAGPSAVPGAVGLWTTAAR